MSNNISVDKHIDYPVNSGIKVTKEYKECLDLMENTMYNLFITGKAGTGKSTLVQYFRNNTKKKVAVLAPTGLAAMNVRGQTIHSFFKFPPKLLTRDIVKMLENPEVYRKLDTVIIDEASMLRADVFDAIERFLRINGKDNKKPFGGVQLILSGDLYQLPPVVTNEEALVFNQLYESPYFFSAGSYADMFQTIELRKIFRQQDKQFIDILNAIRNGVVESDLLEIINTRVNGSLLADHHVVLTTTNRVAESINTLKLNFLNTSDFTFMAHIEGNFPVEDRNLPFALELHLKKGARVLFVKNDASGRWVNGSLGEVDKVDQNYIHVKLDDGGEVVEVGLETWENVKYEYNPATGKLNEDVVGRIKQYPLKLAWAITIHKSQGMTFDRVCLDFRQSPFTHGQTYVALSRCRTLEGIVLTRRIQLKDIMVDAKIVEFMQKGA